MLQEFDHGTSELDDEYLTTTEVSKITRKPIGTLRQWRHRGYGPRGFRIGNTVLYRRSEVAGWLHAQERAELGPDAA